MPNKSEVKRAKIDVEELSLSREYFLNRMVSYESFESFLYLEEDFENPATVYENAVKAFKKLPKEGKKGAEALYEWAYTYVNFKGWEKFRSRLRQQRRLDKKIAKKDPRQTRDFNASTIKRFNRVKAFLETDDNNLVLNHLIDLWENSDD